MRNRALRLYIRRNYPEWLTIAGCVVVFFTLVGFAYYYLAALAATYW